MYQSIRSKQNCVKIIKSRFVGLLMINSELFRIKDRQKMSYWIFFISSSDKPDACMIVSIGTPSARRLEAILSFAFFSPSARPSARTNLNRKTGAIIPTGLCKEKND